MKKPQTTKRPSKRKPKRKQINKIKERQRRKCWFCHHKTTLTHMGTIHPKKHTTTTTTEIIRTVTGDYTLNKRARQGEPASGSAKRIERSEKASSSERSKREIYYCRACLHKWINAKIANQNYKGMILTA